MTEASPPEVHCVVAGGPAACRVIYRVVMTSLLYIGEDRGHDPVSVTPSRPTQANIFEK